MSHLVLFKPITLDPGARGEMILVCLHRMQVTRLVVGVTNNIVVEAFSLGSRSQLRASGPLPASLFGVDSGGPYSVYDIWEPEADGRVAVRNIGRAPTLVSAALLGDLLDGRAKP